MSQRANANCPLRSLRNSGPFSSYRWTRTSVSVLRIELMASGYKILPEIRVIEDLAVVNDPDGAVLIVDRLICHRSDR